MPSSIRPGMGLAPGSLPVDPAALAAYWADVAERQMAILDALPTAIGLVKDHRIVWINAAFTTLLGYSREEAGILPTASYFRDFTTFEALMREVESVIVQGRTCQVDVEMRRKNGECFWGSVSGRLLFPDDPGAGIVWMLKDISERKHAEETLQLTQQRLEKAQEQAKVGSWELGSEFEARFWSKQMYALLGFDPAHGLPNTAEVHQRVHPEDRAGWAQALQKTLSTGEQTHVAFRSNPEWGTLRHFELTLECEFDAAGKPKRVMGTTQDVTERKQAEMALRVSEARLEAAQAQAKIGSWELGADMRTHYWSRQVFELMGLDPAQGVPALDESALRIHPDDLKAVGAAVRRAIDTRQLVRYTHRTNPSFGSIRYLEVSAIPEFDERGRLLRVFGTTQDVTERKQSEEERSKLQEQLQQATKMEAVGRLAGGVAHDFNNLLTVITGNVELALDEVNPDGLLARYLADVEAAAESATSLTRQLLAFSRKQLVEPKIVNLNELIGNLRNMLGRLLGEDIVLELRLSRDLCAVRLDPGQFDQVIVNLAVNARDAMPKGGRLTIETANIELDDDYCRTHREVTPGPYVSLAVTDDGEGMSAEILSHIFEPFFSTKPHGKGTGLGLSVTFGAVKQAGGTIEAYSELGLGTSFKIYLPRIDSPAERLEAVRRMGEAPRGTEIVFVVEDNDHVRGLTTAMLQRLGYRTIVAASGKAALESIRTERPAIDLLLTDLVMPEMSGRELSDKLRELYPSVPVLYCSGYTEDSFVRHGLGTRDLHFLSKPFTLQQLGSKVRQVLDECLKTRGST